MPLLTLKDLSVAYQDREQFRTSLSRVDLEVRTGACLALRGASGSGKTTLLRLVAGLLDPEAAVVEGDLRMRGKPVAPYRAQRRRPEPIRLGWLPQQPETAFNPLFSALDQIAEAASLRGARPKDSPLARARELWERLALPPIAQRRPPYPHELSGGELQRAALARALAVDPELLLADEPDSALDLVTRRDTLLYLAKAQSQHGFAVLVACHDPATARALNAAELFFRGGIVSCR